MAISPSAIEKYELCRRRYFWNYIMKDWEVSSGSLPATAGTAVHRYLEDGVIIPVDGYDIVRLGEVMKPSIPADTGVLCEHKFKTPVEGIEFSGIVDRLGDTFIVDFKTTGSEAKWAKTDRKLLNDTQRLIYAAAFPDRPKSRWITGLWRDYSVVVGERDNVPADRERFKLHVLKPAEEMLALTPGMDPLSLPLPGKQDKYTGLTKACTAFGQTCKFVDRCFPKKRQKLTLPARTASDAILDELTTEAQRLNMGYEPPRVTDRVLPEKSTNDYTFPVLLSLEHGILPYPKTAFALSGSDPCPLLTDKAETRTGPQEITTERKTVTTKKYLIENLYIDCMPIVPYPPGEALEYSYEYIAAAGQEVAGDMGVASPMLVDFGKGPHLVTAQVIAHLSDRAEPIKHLFLETRSAEGRACMQELTSRSKFVVKGSY